jgi:hypothetical protein
MRQGVDDKRLVVDGAGTAKFDEVIRQQFVDGFRGGADFGPVQSLFKGAKERDVRPGLRDGQ